MKKFDPVALIITSMLFPGIAVFGCGRKADPLDRVLARVSSKVITARDLTAKVAKMPAYYKNIVSKNPKKYVEEMIIESLFYEEGVRRGIDRDKEVAEVVSEAKKKIVIAKLIKTEVDDRIKISEDESKKYYDEHKEEFKTPEMWRASHILVTDEKDAKLVLDDLSRGAKFEDLARTRSIDATADRGGDVGFFKTGQLVPDFEKECLKLNVGQTSGIVKTQFGCHIIRLTDRREPGVKSYAEAKREIEVKLKNRKRAELFASLVMKMKSKYNVEVNEDAFPDTDKVPAAGVDKVDKP